MSSKIHPQPMGRTMTRRRMLREASLGFGSIALSSLFAENAFADLRARTHHPAKARHIIFLYMDGGVSQVDTFDPKPRLTRDDGRPFSLKMEPTQFEDNGAVLRGLWDYKQYGQSGLPVSDLFPYVGSCADDLCVVRSMVSNFSEHNAANYFLHTGNGMAGRPSMGAWTTYGLGNLNRDLPGYVVLDGGLIPSGGVDCFASGFLPASYQASMFQNRHPALANVQPLETAAGLQQQKLAAVRRLDAMTSEVLNHPDALEAAIANQELAYRMQMAVPEATALTGESPETLKRYGFEARFEHTRSYARQCLVARRLVERGVRFIELTCPRAHGGSRWDAHGDLKNNHSNNALAIDQPIAALLKDLKARGLLDETLVVWSGEFGRTPFAQGRDGRDHNPFGFTLWMAGGGIKGGMAYGATDDFGYKAVQDRVEVHDLHATLLHLLGFDHERLTFRFGGRDHRLTDVHGHVVKAILA